MGKECYEEGTRNTRPPEACGKRHFEEKKKTHWTSVRNFPFSSTGGACLPCSIWLGDMNTLSLAYDI